MPIHDWNAVRAGEFHDFHQGWSVAIKVALNRGVLPSDYYALIEQPAGDIEPDILTLRASGQETDERSEPGGGALAVETAPPEVAITAMIEVQWYLYKKNRIGIHHASDDKMVAMIEIVSPGNKSSRHRFERFTDKALAALEHGIHLLLIDLFPPSNRDPDGLHAAIWSELGDDSFQAPRAKPLNVVSYVADLPIRAYVEPAAVGDILKPMPLFLTPSHYVSVPLEKTYDEGFAGLPRHLQAVLSKTLPAKSA